MDFSSISRTDASVALTARQSDTVQSESLRNASTAARKLNSLDISDREFATIRDPQSHRFVVVVLERSTGTVLDQFPPEDILKLLSQLSPSGKDTGEASQ